MSSLFPIANHMLLVYSLLYAAGGMLRAFVVRADSSAHAVGISMGFFFLSLWLVLDAILYFKAFVDEMREQEAATDAIGIDSAGSVAPASPITDSSAYAPPAKARPWTAYLRTQAGLAYFLNIVGSVGYCVSSFLSLFLILGGPDLNRRIDQASHAIDTFNMLCFVLDAALFWHVWWREASARADSASNSSLRARCSNVYNVANACNLASSVAYLSFVIWALQRRVTLAQQEKEHSVAGDDGWYEREMTHVLFAQRSMYLASDLLYLLYAVLLEVGWRLEHGDVNNKPGLRKVISVASGVQSALADCKRKQIKLTIQLPPIVSDQMQDAEASTNNQA